MPMTHEIAGYAVAYERFSGHLPTAIPVTHGELLRLREEWEPYLTETIEVPEDERAFGICSFRGMDLYETEEAVRLRAEIP